MSFYSFHYIFSIVNNDTNLLNIYFKNTVYEKTFQITDFFVKTVIFWDIFYCFYRCDPIRDEFLGHKMLSMF